MSKIAIVYWSGTGNTESMANILSKAISAEGSSAELIPCGEFSADDLSEYDAFAFGCPSMGAEVLEESEFQPMWDGIAGSIAGKKIGLFGSYGWGDGEWMRNWAAETKAAGADLVAEGVICNEAPDDAAEEDLKDLAHALV